MVIAEKRELTVPVWNTPSLGHFRSAACDRSRAEEFRFSDSALTAMIHTVLQARAWLKERFLPANNRHIRELLHNWHSACLVPSRARKRGPHKKDRAADSRA